MKKLARVPRKPATIRDLQNRLDTIAQMQRCLGAEAVLDEEFIKGHVQKLHELAAAADPFIKKRLIQLASNYERRLNALTRPMELPLGWNKKASAER